MKPQHTVIVANRLPVSVVRGNDGELEYIESNGGLATAMKALALDDMVWIGWPGIVADDLSDKERQMITAHLAERHCVPVFLTQEQVKLFYEGYANDTLWPLMHYFPSYAAYHDEYWQAYHEVNDTYAAATREHIGAHAQIWVHDYQLMLLPRLLREAEPDSLIGYFHHIPFPSYELYRLLPERREILEGLLGADLIGFHTYDYARHFLSSALRLLGLSNEYGVIRDGDRSVKVDAFPIGIDYTAFAELGASDDTQRRAAEIREAHPYDFLVASVDRLDYSKGILQRLEGYRRFLERHPDYLERIQLEMVAVPSRAEVASYAQLRDTIEQTVSRINGTYGTTSWQPISYQYKNLPADEIVALYRASDALLVTPLRDGMNLVAKEFVAAKGLAPGVLILSEMAGVAEEFPEALLVNPNDSDAIATALLNAVTMPHAQQLWRLAAMQARVRNYSVQAWGQDFLQSLQAVQDMQRSDSTVALRGEALHDLQEAYRDAEQALYVFDYDGTLHPFVPSPEPDQAMPSDELMQLLTALAEHGKVAIVSGRSREALELWFGETDFELVAEHGAEYRLDGTWQQAEIDFEPIREHVAPILADYTSRTPGSRVEQKHYASVWHYRTVTSELAHVRRYNLMHKLRNELGAYPASAHAGSKVIEIKPDNVSKGAAIDMLLERYAPDFVLIAGDDYTDEDMFRHAPDDAYTIKVGPGETAASYRVASVGVCLAVLKKLASR